MSDASPISSSSPAEPVTFSVSAEMLSPSPKAPWSGRVLVRSTTTPTGPCEAYDTVSLPAPPVRTSEPKPPSSVSSPAPPMSCSDPAEPVSTSPPLPPIMMSTSEWTLSPSPAWPSLATLSSETFTEAARR